MLQLARLPEETATGQGNLILLPVVFAVLAAFCMLAGRPLPDVDAPRSWRPTSPMPPTHSPPGEAEPATLSPTTRPVAQGHAPTGDARVADPSMIRALSTVPVVVHRTTR
ncbi:hypothetical protein OG598_00240 [Micromonospora sp. NBC_00330]|uniref:hypothetical protein n=1 Tax=Micromonospora sp. NBC_00330 TaxID=2903585 RepID=UPI002E2C088B|nr:hypothetical protein [Micromonospora sp. NBC_00330]